MRKRRRPQQGKMYLVYRKVGDTLYVELATPEYDRDGWWWVTADGNNAGSEYYGFWEAVPKQKYRPVKFG